MICAKCGFWRAVYPELQVYATFCFVKIMDWLRPNIEKDANIVLSQTDLTDISIAHFNLSCNLDLQFL